MTNISVPVQYRTINCVFTGPLQYSTIGPVKICTPVWKWTSTENLKWTGTEPYRAGTETISVTSTGPVPDRYRNSLPVQYRPVLAGTGPVKNFCTGPFKYFLYWSGTGPVKNFCIGPFTYFLYRSGTGPVLDHYRHSC